MLVQTRRDLQAAGRYMLENGLAWGNAGNISSRTGPQACLITASGTQLGDLAEGDLVECSWSSGEARAPSRKPSKELPMHRAVYEARPEVGAVLHASPFFSTLIACSQESLPSSWFVEDIYYLERVRRVGYFHPGSAELGEAVSKAAAEANILLLENHGVLVYDTSLREASMGLHTLEMAARMWITARSAAIQPKMLPEQVVEDFLSRSGYRPRRSWPL